MASVSGSLMRKRLPRPGSESISTLPPSRSRLVLTTSMPTPRPETSETFSAVERPGRKMSAALSLSDNPFTFSGVINPFLRALAAILAGSRPLPSSPISITTWPASWKARSRTTPSVRLPTRARSAGTSMPWSTALRTMWVRGSLNPSIRVLSSSTSRPSMSSRTSLPRVRARSRTTRGNLPKTLPIGCMRVCMIASCRSEVTRLMRWLDAFTARSSWRDSASRSWLRLSTSSPARFMRVSRTSTLTRKVLSPALTAGAGWAVGEPAAIGVDGGATGEESTGTGSGTGSGAECCSGRCRFGRPARAAGPRGGHRGLVHQEHAVGPDAGHLRDRVDHVRFQDGREHDVQRDPPAGVVVEGPDGIELQPRIDDLAHRDQLVDHG